MFHGSYDPWRKLPFFSASHSLLLVFLRLIVPECRFYLNPVQRSVLRFCTISCVKKAQITGKNPTAFGDNPVVSPASVVMDLYDCYKLRPLLLLLCKSGCGTSTNSEKMPQGPLPCLVFPISPWPCLFFCWHLEFFCQYADEKRAMLKSLMENFDDNEKLLDYLFSGQD